MRVPADAEDLFQDTLRIGLTEREPPDTNDLVAVQRFFGSIMNGLAANRRRAARRHPAKSYDDDAPPSSSRAGPNPERALLEREEEMARRQLKAELRSHVADEPRVLALWDLAEAGVRGRAELARRMTCSLAEVTNLQRRLTYHARRLRERAATGTRRAS
jgi:hypothetical protein